MIAAGRGCRPSVVLTSLVSGRQGEEVVRGGATFGWELY